MLRAFKFSAVVLINLVIAAFGTATLDHGLWRAIPLPSNSVTAVIWKESMLSVIVAGGLGFGVWRIWQTSAAKYVWIPATVWFAFGLVAIPGHNDVIGGLFPFGSAGGPGPAEFRSFFAFAVILIRSVSYSLGSYFSSLLSASPKASNSQSEYRSS